MFPEVVEHAIVTLVAVAAMWVVIRRVFVAVKPAGPAKCASCPVAQHRPELPGDAKPLTLIR